jgi:hypothetical protein
MSKVPTYVISGILAVATSVAGWALKMNFEMAKDMALVKYKLEELSQDSANDQKQDRSISKHWKIVNEHKHQINELRVKEGLPLFTWPDLGE